MKTLKKIMAVLLVLVLTLSMGACKKDCENAKLSNSCLKKMRTLEDKARDLWKYQQGRIDDGQPGYCVQIRSELASVYKECKGSIMTENDHSRIENIIDDYCNEIIEQ